MSGFRRLLAGVLCVGSAALGGAAPAQAVAPEPDYVLFPHLLPLPSPPTLEGPCGIAVSANGEIHVANYHRHSIERFSASVTPVHKTLLTNVDPLDGPCGLSFDAFGRLYVNNYHRNVERYQPAGEGFNAPTVIDSSHPTGVAVYVGLDNVYVNARTYISVYASSGAPVLDGGEPLKIGIGSLGDGYGLAVSRFPLTSGYLYAPDHSDDTVKVYDPVVDKDDPVQVITGPPGGFGSLRDSAVAVDRVTGEVYVADTLAHPQYTERPEAVIYVFDSTGTYKGRLKYAIVDASPPGLAVDNSLGATQSRVYVTSGNTLKATIYAYPLGSATSTGAPATLSLAVSAEGSGGGSVASKAGAVDCTAVCDQQIRSGAEVSLTATPDQGSAFTGWSGADCTGTGTCTVTMDQARSVTARFETLAGPAAPTTSASTAPRKTSVNPTSASTSVITQKGTLRVAVKGKLAPKRLPRTGVAPIAVTVGGEISTTDNSLPPQLKSMRIELNKGGRLDTTGLPPCSYNRIQPGSSQRALSACRDSLVGEGSFTANITLAGQEPYPTSGKLLVFHSVEKGRPVLFGHIYSPKPFATSFVIVFKVQGLGKGTYGTALDAPLPAAMDAWGRLTSLQMTLQRRYSHKGKAHSFISAGCPAPKGFTQVSFPLARTEFSFEGNQTLRSVLNSECKAWG